MSAEIKKFAENVERLCDRLVGGLDHGPDRNAISKLQEQAADIATGKLELLEERLSGVAEELR